MTQPDTSVNLTAGDVQAAVYKVLIGLGINPASAAYATGRAVQALLEPTLTFELDKQYAARAAAAKRRKPHETPIPEEVRQS